MKKILLTAVCLCFVGSLSVQADELIVTQDEFNKMKLNTKVDIVYQSFENAYNNSNVSQKLNVPKSEFENFIVKLKQKYWNKERNVLHVSVMEAYDECMNLKHAFNRSVTEEMVSGYCVSLTVYALKYQMEEQQATKGNKTSQSDAYSFLKSLRKVYPAGNIKGPSPASATEKLFRQDCLKEVLKKNGCTNAWASISQARTVLVCDGSTVSLEQLDASAQNAVKFCEKEPVLPQITRDGWVCTFN